MKNSQWATKLQPECSHGEARDFQGKYTRSLGGRKTYHLAQQGSAHSHLEGLLRAKATTEKLGRVDRNRLEATRVHVRALKKKLSPFPMGVCIKARLGTPR